MLSEGSDGKMTVFKTANRITRYCYKMQKN